MIPDIEKLLVSGVEVPPERLQAFATNLAMTLGESLSNRERKATLRMSNIGKPCERQLYYEVNSPDEGEVFRPETYLKFMYGHLVEELVLFLAELAGHKVEGRQDESDIRGIKGHRDAVIDGRLVDVKSASTFSFKKFKEGKLKEDDPFGYIGQIQSYLYDAQTDPIVTDKDSASFLVMDKTLGHLLLDTHKKDETDWPAVFDQKIDMVKKDTPPDRGFEPEAMGVKGNMKLPKPCSYCSFKFKCYDDLRTFAYSYGPVFLTSVVDEPRVPELNLEEDTLNLPELSDLVK